VGMGNVEVIVLVDVGEVVCFDSVRQSGYR
jgi:hypothetical protein